MHANSSVIQKFSSTPLIYNSNLQYHLYQLSSVVIEHNLNWPIFDSNCDNMFLSIASILEVTVFRDKLIVSKSFLLSGQNIANFEHAVFNKISIR